ncbi:Protein of unknown function DUF2189, transmembrane [Thioalkalivibrio nitratireducens DSM 14787]|uniref:Integral membrane protein n=1 Tax=Thioalkalivibrio nitratireducens (strain DSM 14787 / UNIQEM 213 / ALEN2) TaxID=1255043 RepID=L0DYH1_THIND|nr:Protein of unknown function DUF2189, transmembrane [Thioalkalivibrio nitratireducens DSM 14787]
MDDLIKRRYPEDLGEIRPRQTLDTGTPPVRQISARHPLKWLAAGWRDIWRAPASLLHGLFVTVVGLAILWYTWDQPWLAMAAISGFLLVGPALAVGVNELARRLEHGGRQGLGIGQCLAAIPALGGSLWLFAVLLAGLFIVWAGFMTLWIGVMNVGDLGVPANLGELLGAMLGSARGILSLIGVVVAGGVLALVAFAVGVVTVPAMLDRRVGVVDAIAISLKAFARNRVPMLVWAALITALFGLSVLTALIALIVVFPWLGFAMWHGYRDVVVADEGAEAG